MLTRSEAVILSTDWEWRHAFARTLEANGVDFVLASRVEDCRRVVERESVELIFWDSHSEADSYQELLQLLSPPSSRAKIVVVSHMDDGDRPGVRKGAFAVIPFPGQPTDVEWVLSRASRAAFLDASTSQIRELPTHA